MARTQRKAPAHVVSTRATRRRARASALEPEQDDHDLSVQLREMGLYAAETHGDGNCLFRALSDQLYGDPKYHAKLRADTCDHLAAHADMYAGFVEAECPYEAYVDQMRTHGTYGGHLELSAFAHLTQKRIRIVQPGYVYVVACDDDSYSARASRERRERHRRHMLAQDTPPRGTPPECVGPLHIAYHSWEHYSSLRLLRGPHKGHPNIPDTSHETEDQADAEHLVDMSVPGHSQRTIRRLLRAHHGAWEDVVEELIERDANGDESPYDDDDGDDSDDDHDQSAPPRPAKASEPGVRELTI